MINDGNYVYELAYPENMGGAVFYVGQGRGDRINQHEAEARRGGDTRKHKAIREIWANGEEVIKRKVAEHLSDIDAKHLETDLIVKYGIKNLTNLRNEARDRQIQFMTTKEVKSWLESQRIKGESISQTIYRIIEEAMLEEEKMQNG